jgi:PAS domain S-box-containing protein
VQAPLDQNGSQADALDRLTRLQALTASLSEAVTSGQVAAAILTQAAAVLGATAGVVARLSDDGTELVCLHATGYPEHVVQALSRFPADARMPLADAVRDRQPVLLSSLAERDTRYPDVARFTGFRAEGAVVALPLVVRGKATGGIGLRFPTTRAFTEQDRAFLLTVADLCAQALERARLYDTERAARARAEQTEEALRESEERFARFMQHLPGLAWVKDVQGRYVYVNDAAMNAFGKARSEILGRRDEEIFPPGTAAVFRENDRKALAGPAGVRVVEPLEHADGALHHSLVSKFPIPGPDRVVAWVGGMAIDVTEDVRTRAVLEESEERFRATFEQAAVGIAHVGLDGRWLRVNRKLCDVVGYAPDELMGLTFQDITHPDDLQADLAQVRRLLAGEIGTYSMEKRYARKDRSLAWANLTVSLVRTPAGQPKYFISVVEDITEKKQVQDALRESEERLRTLSNNLPHGAVYQGMGDREGRRRVTYISAGVERLLGVTPAEVMADAYNLYGLVHEEDLPRMAAAEEAALRDSAPFDCEFRSHTRGGALRWVQARSAPRRLPTGETVWEGILTDVTDRKRAEEALREADRRKDDFLATLAHELRNPLAPLRTGLHLLRLAGPDRATAEQALAVMERQLAQMVRLIDDLMDLSRITRGKLRLRKERVDLADVVRSAVETARPLIETSAHRLAVALPPEPVWLDADPTRLAQVLANLLNNAAKYTERGGDISLTAARAEGEVVVSVRDTGIGIAAEHLPRLFEMFSQAAPALERSQGGLGIGLALVEGLVEMHGGTVAAKSEGPGKGSELVVRLPVADASPVPAPSVPGGERPGASLGRRVLVADDNRDAADSLATMLRLAGHEVHAAHDGQEAVEAAAWFRPEVALLDIGMPRLNGYEAARRIRELPWGKGVVLVAVTGWGQEEDRRRAREAGFDHHLTKPADPAAIERLLAGVKTA